MGEGAVVMNDVRVRYHDLLARKSRLESNIGMPVIPEISPVLFPFQRDVVRFLLEIGRGAAFLDTGLGKTLVQLEWARHIPGRVLILAPLAVAAQTVEEANDKLGMETRHPRDGTTGDSKIVITNYERLEEFDVGQFTGVVLDESSILKSFMGKTKERLIEAFKDTPYRLCCTATPAPNDYMELGNHSDFLGVMRSNEMLSRWFINDTMAMGKYRLKGHAVKPFWEWIASWAACVSLPSDLGYDDDAFALPPLTPKRHICESELRMNPEEGMLFDIPRVNATELHAEKRATLEQRVQVALEVIGAEPDEPWIVWCESNDESQALAKAFPNFVEVRGSMTAEMKESRLVAFSKGEVPGIITKPSIAGFGLNWQHSARVLFASLSFSFENFYQAIRRSWRFGQVRPVNVHVIISTAEVSVWETVERKMNAHDSMKESMRHASKAFAEGLTKTVKVTYNPTCKAQTR